MAKWEKKGVRRAAEGWDEGTQSFTAEENRGPWLKWPLSLGSPPAASPPVARFTAIRFLPPLRAFVLSYCLRCCFLRGANVLRLLSLLVRSSTFLSSLVVFDFRFLSVSRSVRFSRLRSFPFVVSSSAILVFSFSFRPVVTGTTLVLDTNEYICSGKKQRIQV